MSGLGKRVFVLTVESLSRDKWEKKLARANFSWTYLGYDVNEFRSAQEVLGHRGTYLEVTNMIHETSKELRSPYLDLLYNIGQEVDSIHWWITSISYRNGVVTKIFHEICLVKVAIDLVASQPDDYPLILIVNDSIAQGIKANLNDNRVLALRERWSWGKRVSIVWDSVNMLFHRCYFLLREIPRLVQARSESGVSDIKGELTVIFAWATLDNVARESEFHKSFFGDLVTNLERLGSQVAVSPIVLRDVPYKKFLKGIKISPNRILVAQRYLTVKDLFLTTLQSMAYPPTPDTLPYLETLNIASLIKAHLRKDWISNGAAEALMMATLIKRWSEVGLKIRRIIYVYENQPLERAICWQSARSLPKAKVIGYQHAGLPQMLLNFWISSAGEIDAPLPHKIVSVGKYTARLLVNGGYPESQIRVGGALQIRQLLELRTSISDLCHVNGNPSVLVATSDSLEETVELVNLAKQLFSPDADRTVIIKLHPRMPFEKVKNIVGESFPANVKLCSESISDLIARSSLMVYSGSTVGIQAMALSLPLIHVRTQFDLDLDPLDSVPNLRLEATGLDELRTMVEWLLDNRDEFVEQHKHQWDRLVDDFYSPITDQTYRAFLE